jgi:CBS domain-containing protein
MKVRDIMTSEGLTTATPDTTLEEIAIKMREENIGAIPIIDDGNITGIITDRDIVVRAVAEGEDCSQCTAEEILSEELRTIEAEALIEDAAELMARYQIRRLPVLEEGELVGMISLGDVSVKAGEDQAGPTLGEISEGVKEKSPRGRSADARSHSPAAVSLSPGERVSRQEAEYQRQSSGRQSGSDRAESAQAGRVRNQSQSRQTVENEMVDVEGEEEPRFQNAGGGNARRRANQQQSARGRDESSVRGRESGDVRGRNRTQGVSNRSVAEESKRQQKVAPMRAEASSTRNKSKRRAS